MKRDYTISQELRIHQQNIPGSGWVLSPQGPIDSNTTEEFRRGTQDFLEASEASNLLLDMSGVKYISSIGLGALIQLLKKSREAHSTFALYNPQLAVRRVLEISKLDFLLVKPEDAATAGPFSEYVARKESQRLASTKK